MSKANTNRLELPPSGKRKEHWVLNSDFDYSGYSSCEPSRPQTRRSNQIQIYHYYCYWHLLLSGWAKGGMARDK